MCYTTRNIKMLLEVSFVVHIGKCSYWCYNLWSDKLLGKQLIMIGLIQTSFKSVYIISIFLLNQIEFPCFASCRFLKESVFPLSRVFAHFQYSSLSRLACLPNVWQKYNADTESQYWNSVFNFHFNTISGNAQAQAQAQAFPTQDTPLSRITDYWLRH